MEEEKKQKIQMSASKVAWYLVIKEVAEVGRFFGHLCIKTKWESTKSLTFWHHQDSAINKY